MIWPTGYRSKVFTACRIRLHFLALSVLVGLLFLTYHPLLAQQNYYLLTNNVKARPLGMGGAFMAVQDDLPTFLWNPAAFSLYNRRGSPAFRFFLSPLAPLGSLYHFGLLGAEDRSHRNWSVYSKILLGIGSLFKGMSWSHGPLAVAMMLLEETTFNVAQRDQQGPLGLTDTLDNHSNSILVRFKLSPKVALGIRGSLYTATSPANQRTYGWGFSYGILLQPARKIWIGLSFLRLPSALETFRKPVEHLENQTINSGIVYRLRPNTILAMDIRDVTGTGNLTFLQVLRWKTHWGIEQMVHPHLVLRGGYWMQEASTNPVFSVGIGLFDLNRLKRRRRRMDHRTPLLNYTFINQQGDKATQRWHFFSLVVGF